MRLYQWIAVPFCFLLTACTSTPQSWYGTSTKKLFNRLGYPDRVVRLREGRYLLIYLRKGTPCKAIFKINHERKVISTHFRGGKECKQALNLSTS